MKKDKIHTLITAVFTVAVIMIVGSLIVLSWNNHKLQRQKAAEIAEKQEAQLEAEREQAALEAELKEKTRDAEIEALKQQILDLQTKAAINAKVPVASSSSNDQLANLVKKWSPRVAHIECHWYDSKGSLSGRANGSATIVYFTGTGIRAVTSKHILFDIRGNNPKDCKVELLSGSVYTVLVNDANVMLSRSEDWAYLTLPSDTTLTNLTREKLNICKNVNVGDSLVVLGYPKIGSKSGLTVTEGIVSGIDDVYYITSAKIDKGNSGGAAFLVKDACYLGIPTASVVGTIESLGRILKASFVIGN